MIKPLGRLLKNISNDLFFSGFYPAGDIKSYHLKYWLIFVVNIYLKVYHRVEVINSEKIPQTGGAVIASNHTSHLDGIIINSITAFHTRRKITFLAAEDVYNQNFLFKFLCNLGNCIPVKRSTSDRVGLLKVIKLLRKDNLVGLFPEGQRSHDGSIGDGKLGVAIMALKAGVHIIQLAIQGNDWDISRSASRLTQGCITTRTNARGSNTELRLSPLIIVQNVKFFGSI